MSIMKFVIADDHKIFRQGLRYALVDDHRLKCLGEAENGIELLNLIEKQRPDVALVDVKMPEMDGIEATKRIRASYPGIKILILTTYDDENLILHLLDIGINGFLLKNAEPDEIKKAIYYVYEHDYYFNDLVSNTMLRSITTRSKLKEAVKLNERETEVLKLICGEMTAVEIAAKIFLSPRTVEGIRTNLIEKTGAKNTAGLVIFALKNGIVS
jgi:DNA-binding NarL/FixJ family response regulator